MKRAILPILLAPLISGSLATQAAAFPCIFTTECYESEACQSAAYEVEVDIAAEALGDEAGNMVIVAVKETDTLTTLFASGQGAEYMMSITPTAARMTSHINDGPLVISYLGHCEGAF